jgi:uncharacterized membrane protein YedE/YeeE
MSTLPFFTSLAPFVGTFFEHDALDSTAALLVAAFVGVAFGTFLEQAGFGSSRRLAGIFYLADLAVVKVLMSAIVTAAVGLRVFESAGLLAPAQVHQLSTFLPPQVVGGLIFGVGFVVGGWCPGTALVGAASGRFDALVFLVAAGGGSLAYAAWPAASSFATKDPCGVCTLPTTLGLSPGTVVLLLVAMALVVFVVAERFEAARARRRAASGSA